MNDVLNERILSLSGLIYKIASRYKDYYCIEDLYQAGCLGVIKANNCYISNDNTKFSTYAYKFILGEIIDYIRKDKNIIISDEAYDIYKRYLKVKDLLYLKFEREVTFSEVCNYIGIDEDKMLNIIRSVSLFKSINEDEKNCNCYYSDDRESIDNEILLRNELNELDEFDRKIIDYRYYQGYSQSETAEIMGLSQSKVSRCEKLILSKMKNNIA